MSNVIAFPARQDPAIEAWVRYYAERSHAALNAEDLAHMRATLAAHDVFREQLPPPV